MGERGHCTVCGRELRTPESLARGRGRVCDAKLRPAVPAPATLPGLSGSRPAGQPGPDLLDVDAEDGDR